MDRWTALTQPLTFPLRVRRFLTEGTGLERVPEQMRRALATREGRFLEILKHRIYARRSSPHRPSALVGQER